MKNFTRYSSVLEKWGYVSEFAYYSMLDGNIYVISREKNRIYGGRRTSLRLTYWRTFIKNLKADKTALVLGDL
jgi:hypothetical protein